MKTPYQKLLSAALAVLWERGQAENEQAVRLLAERVPGFSDEQYLQASTSAREMSHVAYELAAAWFASRGKAPQPRADDVADRCPGFHVDDYIEAIQNNLLWARK
jgi:hypothetical protein